VIAGTAMSCSAPITLSKYVLDDDDDDDDVVQETRLSVVQAKHSSNRYVQENTMFRTHFTSLSY
jgi:DNA-directed RNA polymerase specialized sigma24 family protein